MGIVQDTREMVAKGRVTVIDGQITQEGFTKLVQELCQIGSSIPTSIGGGTRACRIDPKPRRLCLAIGMWRTFRYAHEPRTMP